jgi:hypothetical protein
MKHEKEDGTAIDALCYIILFYVLFGCFFWLLSFLIP